MSDGFTIVMFVFVMLLFLVLAYNTGALNVHHRRFQIATGVSRVTIFVTENPTDAVDSNAPLANSG